MDAHLIYNLRNLHILDLSSLLDSRSLITLGYLFSIGFVTVCSLDYIVDLFQKEQMFIQSPSFFQRK